MSPQKGKEDTMTGVFSKEWDSLCSYRESRVALIVDQLLHRLILDYEALPLRKAAGMRRSDISKTKITVSKMLDV